MNNSIDFLKKVPIFGGLNQNEYATIHDLMKKKSFKRDDVIFSQEEMGDSLFIIVNGRIKVALYSETGKELILSILKSGDFFGEMSLLDGEPRSANIIAVEDSTLLILERKDFISYLEKSPSLSLKILKIMSKRLRITDEQIGSLALLDVYGRIARFLINVAKTDGKKVDEGIIIEPKLTHQEIAGMVGTSRETVSRTLSDLQKKGLLIFKEKHILIKNEAIEEVQEKYSIYPH
jgi:CRP-like cAMP-binding protein